MIGLGIRSNGFRIIIIAILLLIIISYWGEGAYFVVIVVCVMVFIIIILFKLLVLIKNNSEKQIKGKGHTPTTIFSICSFMKHNKFMCMCFRPPFCSLVCI